MRCVYYDSRSTKKSNRKRGLMDFLTLKNYLILVGNGDISI